VKSYLEELCLRSAVALRSICLCTISPLNWNEGEIKGSADIYTKRFFCKFRIQSLCRVRSLHILKLRKYLWLLKERKRHSLLSLKSIIKKLICISKRVKSNGEW